MGLSGTSISCEWVRERLGAYYGWDPSLSRREFVAIGRHLEECVACAAVWTNGRETRDVVERAVATCDPHRMSHQALLARVMARLEAKDSEREAMRVARRVKWMSVSAAQAAAMILLIVAVPVMAYVGARVWLASDDSIPAGQRTSSTATTASEPSSVPPGPSFALETGSSPLSTAYDIEVDHLASLDADIDEVLIEAEIATLLPQTEEEYEAWARIEYPHIMWLYDILTKPEYGVNWRPGPIRRFEESNEPGLPFTEASLGWRKLLIDSGEIFRFDWPMRVDDPKCIPSVSAIRNAASVAGFTLSVSQDGKWTLPDLDFAENPASCRRFDLTIVRAEGPLSMSDQEIPVDYIEHVSAQLSVAKTVLVYLSVSSDIVDTPEFDDLSDLARMLLYEHCIGGSNKCCNTNICVISMQRLFARRRELIERKREERLAGHDPG